MDGIPLLHLNGLGRGHHRITEKLFVGLYRNIGIDVYPLDINWYGGESFDEMMGKVLVEAGKMLKTSGRLIIMGTSAGGSLGLNAFHELSQGNVCFINDRGRLRVGDYLPTDRNSLQGRSHGSLAFRESVINAELILDKLTNEQKQRILIMTAAVDLVVPKHLSTINRVRTHQSMLTGHNFGNLRHWMSARKTIADFAAQTLPQKT